MAPLPPPSLGRVPTLIMGLLSLGGTRSSLEFRIKVPHLTDAQSPYLRYCNAIVHHALFYTH